MDHQQSSHPDELDERLTVLADQMCRFTVVYFRDASDDVVSVDDLATEICTYDPDREHVKMWLHHSALPRLEDHGIVDYDATSKTIRYRAGSELEPLVDSIGECH